MFEPVRGGTRGGQAEFKWSDVSQDKDRENYLGHSINAPTGRWQKNKDVHWYQRDAQQDEVERLEEIKQIKEIEAEALAAALGFATGNKSGSSATAVAGPATGSNTVAVPKTNLASPSASVENKKDEEKEEKRRRKAQRKEEKKARKEEKKKRKAEYGDDDEPRRRRHHSRSRSPRRHSRDSVSRRPRSRTPPSRTPRDYDPHERERERERDRKRWDDNAQRDRPGSRWSRD